MDNPHSAGVVSSAHEAQQLFRKGDDDCDGNLTLEEFVDCFDELREAPEVTPEDQLTSLFRSLDDDQTGWVVSIRAANIDCPSTHWP